jgi:hypothetical protein
MSRIANPVKEVARPVQAALASIASSVQASRYVRTWVGSQRGDGGKTRVTVVWEPAVAPPGSRRESVASLSILAADAAGGLVFRGRSGGAAGAPAATGAARGGPTPPGSATGSAQSVSFDAPPGKLELRLTAEGADGAGTLDRETQTVELPDYSAPEPTISTPRVHRARTARDVQLLQADAAAVPTVGREFSRTERLLIRFETYAPGGVTVTPVARLLNRAGDTIAELPVSSRPAGGHAVDVGLNTVPPGEYLVQLVAPSATGEASTLVAFRIGS